MKKRILLTALAGFAAAGIGFAQEQLALQDYLSQVEQNSAEIKSVNLAIDSAVNKTRELDMAYSPYFSAAASYAVESGAGFGSALPAKEMDVTAWNLGLSKKWQTGSTLTLGYSDTSMMFDLLYPTAIIGPEKLSSFTGYEVKPSVKIEQSLMKEFLGGQSQSAVNKAKSLNRAGIYGLIFKKQQLLLRARLAYWSLSLSREVVAFRKTSLDRAQELLKWSENRVSLDLADRSDLLQAQAAYKMRQLNYQLALEDEVKACRVFNELRGSAAETVEQALERISDAPKKYEGLDSIRCNGERADLLAAKEVLKGAQYAQKEAFKRSGPELSVFGTASLKGLDLSYSGALQQISDADKPAYAVGLVFFAPIDFKVVSRVRKAYKSDYESAREALGKTELSVKNDWDELFRTWKNVKSRVSLAKEIKDIQSERVAVERDKSKRGRTTTFLLLNSENDLDDATLNEYRLIFEELNINAQSELYCTTPVE
ncbi:MAG TPA: hypothetical protein DEE98_05695 [Elusimicrobia bacterium]|nr:MAG: hypothetical protein A2278_00960 [Elusimicrobia bacterium RIFOXYA12_FULL_49_49]OGS09619.1 MAG: hypothetical protein A2204_00910 [Elusimicrobia bacterium RIFOXYA1_FULL_47_7]OGS11415.1 MAG: hypothetical protein A2386_04835 [Elusimicrobia bacterium RIFOXYB1_FULL_48_9]OGS15041.1 MAG: hypothetical protein A2251_00080 [Elusimicrobia bacterium RIFOXYA2_FULL_47_53]OGS29379.1 MAG: hypothetical protein A2323_00365 [Elusimicrobia bacterium RIFOXYB2_FULL_46_23]HBU69860.1 hypothetical protein [Elus